MRIVKFSAENIKKLKVVEITPTGNIVEVTGPNGSGKSSVLDAIFYALSGTSEVPSAVVRQGEDHAVVKLDLGELKVTRRFTAKGGTTLIVEAANGARFPSPQHMLDDLIGSLSFDPLAFIRMKPREQLEALRQVVKLDVDIDALDRETKMYFDARQSTNREVKALEARLEASPAVAGDTPDEEIDVAKISEQLRLAAESNQKIDQEHNERMRLELKIQDDLRNADQKVNTIAQISDEAQRQIDAIITRRDQTISELQEVGQELQQRAVENKLKLEKLQPLPWPVDLKGFQEKIKQATIINNNVRLKQHRVKLQDELKLKQSKAESESMMIASQVKLRTETIAKAEMPVAGLSFNDNEVLYNGLPLTNASGGEQLRISVALAMAANPKLRVLRVKDGSLLDEANMKLLASLAGDNNYQVWVERVEDSHGRPSVVMEEGLVRPAAEQRSETGS